MNITPVFDAGNPAYKALHWQDGEPYSPIFRLSWADGWAQAASDAVERGQGIHAGNSLPDIAPYVRRTGHYLIARVCPVPPYARGESGWRASAAVITDIIAVQADRETYRAMQQWAQGIGLPLRWDWPTPDPCEYETAALADGLAITADRLIIHDPATGVQSAELLSVILTGWPEPLYAGHLTPLRDLAAWCAVHHDAEGLSQVLNLIGWNLPDRAKPAISGLTLSDMRLPNVTGVRFYRCTFRNMVIGAYCTLFDHCSVENTTINAVGCTFFDCDLRGMAGDLSQSKLNRFRRCTR